MRQVLTFNLGTEAFGVDILRVHEIRGWSAPTQLPKAPAHLLGVLNLRGSIVPIVDLRIRLAMDVVEFTPLTVIVVLSVNTARGRRDVGVVVDSVSDVMDIDGSALKDAPTLDDSTDTRFVECLAAVGDRLFILLDVDTLVSDCVDQAA